MYVQKRGWLSHGEVHGSVVYGQYLNAPSATFVDASPPTGPTSPFPLDFAAARTRLIEMSQALSRYDAIAATKQYSTVEFIGTDPELNVFSVAASSLVDTYDYYVSVPAGSSVIINVSGTNPAIRNAGFRGRFDADKTLWNFYQASTLTLSSVGFSGSILAPTAAAVLGNGNVRGTIVVDSASADVELYMAPFNGLSASGCLNFDPTWSCSGDTPVDEAGRAVLIEPEAGFLEILGGPYVAEGVARVSPKHRVWYSYRPARKSPRAKPIAVFFNGGPGTATSSWLFAFNTGPITLDPQRTGAGTWAYNTTADWSEFANLLYIDAPGTGFSYAVAEDDGAQPSLGIDMDRDASAFMRVLMRFFARHPSLRDNPVVLVGESYGGARSILMIRHLYQYATLTDPTNSYQDAQLSLELTDYFLNVFGTPTPTFAQLNEKFNREVLIQPAVAGKEQLDHDGGFDPVTNCMSDGCWKSDIDVDSQCDPYNCDWSRAYSDSLRDQINERLNTVATLRVALGVNPETIDWMKASARANAYGRSDGLPYEGDEAVGDMADVFGTLGPDDAFYVPDSGAVLLRYPGARFWEDPADPTTGSESPGSQSAYQFAANTYYGVETFITVARHDSVIYTPAIPSAINALVGSEPALAELLTAAGHNWSDSYNELSRPGLMALEFTPTYGGQTIKMAMPCVYEAGHTVSMRAPIDLMSDVNYWLSHILER